MRIGLVSSTNAPQFRPLHLSDTITISQAVLAEIISNGPLSGPLMPISSDAAVRAALPGEHTVANAPGLILRVLVTRKGLARSWVVRATDGGRRRRLGLGRYPDVGLAKARTLAQEAHGDIADGVDPSRSAKRRQRAAQAARTLTLGKAIDGYLADAARPYKNAKSDRIRDRALHIHFAPLHARDVASITAIDVAAVLRGLASETAAKAQSTIRAVFDYAAATLEPHGVVIVNPADPRRLRQLGWSPKSRSEGKSLAAIHWRLAPSVVDELSCMDDIAAACTLLIIATGVRAGTARLAKWSDVDLEARTWTPPFADLKEKHHKRAFAVPLNDAAIDALKRVRSSLSLSSNPSPRYVFPNSAGGPITDRHITVFLRKLRRQHSDWVDRDTKRPMTVHGFRATFRTWVEEMRADAAALAELSLGHQVHGEVAARYIRTGLIEERRTLLDAWSRHLRGETAEIIQIRATR
jgi:integrase